MSSLFHLNRAPSHNPEREQRQQRLQVRMGCRFWGCDPGEHVHAPGRNKGCTDLSSGSPDWKLVSHCSPHGSFDTNEPAAPALRCCSPAVLSSVTMRGIIHQGESCEKVSHQFIYSFIQGWVIGLWFGLDRLSAAVTRHVIEKRSCVPQQS